MTKLSVAGPNGPLAWPVAPRSSRARGYEREHTYTPADAMITQPKAIDSLYDSLPATKRQQIEQRDKSKE